MRLWRGVSACELLHLFAHGRVNADVAPWAVTQIDELFTDTDPRPPVGVLMLYPEHPMLDDGRVLVPQFGFPALFEVPKPAIVWRGRGRYWTRDFVTCEVSDFVVDEVAVPELRLEWLRRVRYFPIEEIEELSVRQFADPSDEAWERDYVRFCLLPIVDGDCWDGERAKAGCVKGLLRLWREFDKFRCLFV